MDKGHTSLPEVGKASHALVHNSRVVAGSESRDSQGFDGSCFHSYCFAIAGCLLKDRVCFFLQTASSIGV